MNDIILMTMDLFAGDFLLNLAIILTVIGFTFTVLKFFFEKEKETAEEENKKTIEIKSKFFITVLNGLEKGAIGTLEDINNIYEGLDVSTFEDSSRHRDHLSKWLKELIVELISREKDESLEGEVLKNYHQKISEFIHRIEEESPYSDISEIERSILIDISIYLEAGNKENAERKLSELAGMIRTRSDDLNKIRNTNKWTTFLALAGMVFTIIFGLLTILR